MDSYTNLSRAYGVSVQSLKKTLVGAGYLLGKAPTERATLGGVAQIIQVDGGRFSTGPTEMVLWDETLIARLMGDNGKEASPECRVYSGHSAADRLNEAGEVLSAQFGELHKDGRRQSEAALACCDFMYEGIELLGLIADKRWSEAATWVSSKRQSIEQKILTLHRQEQSPDEVLAMKKIAAVEAWLTKPRRK
jgi:hypothetical protein